MKTKYELVWAETTYVANTTAYFKLFKNLPTDNTTLNAERNIAKLKHTIISKKIWASLNSVFQIEILGNKEEFTVSDAEKDDGPMLYKGVLI